MERRTTDAEIATHPWHHRRHHRPDGGFTNVWGTPRAIPAWKTVKWVAGHAFQRKQNVPAPSVPVDAAALKERPARLRVTWLGHASTLVQTAARNVLLDPMFGERASPFSFAGPRREVPPPLAPAHLPPIDVVLFSHDHYDHLDPDTVRALHRRHAPVFLAPLGVGAILRGWGVSRVLELDWWQYVDLGGLRYHCTPARHFSGRGLTGRDDTLWAGWYLEPGDGAFTLFYAGDTAYADHLEEIRARLGAPEVAILPVGAYEPRWFMEGVHVSPDEAVGAFRDLQSDVFIPVHWGTFDLADEPLQEPYERLPRHAAEQGVSERLQMLAVGASYTLAAREGRAPAPSPHARPEDR